MPAASDAWRAGAWPRPAGSTQPKMTSEISSGESAASASAARAAVAASCGAGTASRLPWKEPIGVRRAAAMTMDSVLMVYSSRVQAPPPVARNSSRPISMRRISLVPAPISYSLASRSSRPVGYSLM
jgi:hypothetical protein